MVLTIAFAAWKQRSKASKSFILFSFWFFNFDWCLTKCKMGFYTPNAKLQFKTRNGKQILGNSSEITTLTDIWIRWFVIKYWKLNKSVRFQAGKLQPINFTTPLSGTRPIYSLLSHFPFDLNGEISFWPPFAPNTCSWPPIWASFWVGDWVWNEFPAPSSILPPNRTSSDPRHSFARRSTASRPIWSWPSFRGLRRRWCRRCRRLLVAPLSFPSGSCSWTRAKPPKTVRAASGKSQIWPPP